MQTAGYGRPVKPPANVSATSTAPLFSWLDFSLQDVRVDLILTLQKQIQARVTCLSLDRGTFVSCLDNCLLCHSNVLVGDIGAPPCL